MIRRVLLASAALLLVVLAVVSAAAWHEATRSTYQARRLGELARAATFAVAPGPSDAIRFPGAGPYDVRLGHGRIPEFATRLASEGYAITAQARISPTMADLVDRGLFAPYREKSHAGLTVRDCAGDEIYRVSAPVRRYEHAEAVPPLVARTLSFIEDRELLDNPHPTRNPAIDWRRSMRAGLDLVRGRFDADHPQPGGSTLATQIEKYRHSPGGVTDSPAEKLRQVASASVRAYLDGPDTTAARRRILVDYLDTVPLAARSGYGEVLGLGDGLWAWYGADFEHVNAMLANEAAPLAERARAYRQVLSLMIAHRRPSEYLGREHAALAARTDGYLRVLASAGVITPALRDAALRTPLELLRQPPEQPRESFVQRKAATAARVELASLLGMPRLYDLDRLDLAATSTIDRRLQDGVTEALAALATRSGAAAAGLLEPRLLAGADPAGVTYSFTLYEITPAGAAVRVQTDNADQPFDGNAGLRLDLGSTAKLRTVVTYLEAMARLHARLAPLDDAALAELRATAPDVLTRWAAARLLAVGAERRTLADFLQDALARTYSADPSEGFRTGGSVLRFANFDPEDDVRTLDVREAFRRSVNLVFVRLMRDVVEHTIAVRPDGVGRVLAGDDEALRRELLGKFAEQEGSAFVRRFHARYSPLAADDAEARLLGAVRATPTRLAAIHRYLEPTADVDRFADWLRVRLPGVPLEPARIATLHRQYAPERMALVDRAYVAGVNPLELWTVRFLRERPGATRADAVAASAAERQAAYAWLFRTRSRAAQDERIRTVLERLAFDDILVAWQRLGYPFQTLSPALGSALGSSADRPAALAELVGILLNDGVRVAPVRITALRLAEGTPFETHFAAKPRAPERVLESEVAAAARALLLAVVEGGTAARLQGTFRLSDGTPLAVGGKTGTGDHRVDRHGRDGRVVESRVISRSGTFAFFLGPRHYGTLSAYVSGPRAGDYRFTSALPTQVLRTLAPILQRELSRAAGADARCVRVEGGPTPRPTVTAPIAPRTRPEPLDTAPATPVAPAPEVDAGAASGDQSSGQPVRAPASEAPPELAAPQPAPLS